MGDGRYYTYYQFLGILLLVMLSMFVLASMVIGYYRNSGNQNEKKMVRLFFVLSTIISLKIVEFVIPKKETGLLIRSIIGILMIFIILKWLEYLNANVFKILTIKKIYIVEFICCILVGTAVFTKGNFFISNYNFYKTEFYVAYIIIWCLLFVIVLLFSLKICFSKKQIHRIYQNKSSLIIMILFLLIPIGVYGIMLVKKIPYIDYAEIFVLVMLAAVFNIIMYSQSPSGITVLTFNKIGDIISDYVLVVDNVGKVIYKNSRINQSDFFATDEKIDIENLEKIYQPSAIRMYNPEGDEYIKMSCGEVDCYFTHRCDPIKNQEETIGYIITIVDISELMELLHLLKEMKEKSNETNLKLKNYAEVVYNIEKEKEINALLEKILSTREKDMYQLIKHIEELMEHENLQMQTDFQEEIDFLITYNQKVLEEVRATVSAYR